MARSSTPSTLSMLSRQNTNTVVAAGPHESGANAEINEIAEEINSLALMADKHSPGALGSSTGGPMHNSLTAPSPGSVHEGEDPKSPRSPRRKSLLGLPLVLPAALDLKPKVPSLVLPSGAPAATLPPTASS
eukprot:RCo049517